MLICRYGANNSAPTATHPLGSLRLSALLDYIALVKDVFSNKRVLRLDESLGTSETIIAKIESSLEFSGFEFCASSVSPLCRRGLYWCDALTGGSLEVVADKNQETSWKDVDLLDSGSSRISGWEGQNIGDFS